MSEWESNLLFDESSTGASNNYYGSSFSESETCFLCLIDISSQNSLIPNDDPLNRIEPIPYSTIPPEEFSLLNICRYLKLNSEKDFAQFVTQNETSNFSVNLCQQCLSICSNLSDLCSEWELLQMKINQNLKQFSGTLENSVDCHFQTSTNPGQLLDDSRKDFLKCLREQLKTNCHQKLKSATDTFIPPNLVPNISEYSPDTEQAIPENSPTTGEINCSGNNGMNNLPGPSRRRHGPLKRVLLKCPDCPSEFKHKRNLCLHQKKTHPQVFRITKPELDPHTSVENGRRICNLCNRKMPDLEAFKRHKFNKHIEAYFETSKLPHLSTEQFKIYCEHVIKIDMLPGTDDTGPSRQCPHCPESFLHIRTFKNHLVLTHEKILAGKIVALQKSSSLSEIRRWSSELAEKSTFDCDTCSSTFAHKYGLEKHKRLFCTGRKHKPKTVVISAQKICKLCTPHLSVTETSYRRHQTRFHLEIFFMSSKFPEISQTDFKIYCDHVIKVEVQSCKESSSVFKCVHCSAGYSDHSSIYQHVFSEHKQILAEKIVHLQQSHAKTEEEENDGDEMATLLEPIVKLETDEDDQVEDCPEEEMEEEGSIFGVGVEKVEPIDINKIMEIL